MNKNDLLIIKRALTDIDCYETKRLEALPHVQMPDSDNFKRETFALMATARQKKHSAKKLIIALIAAAILVSSALTVYAFKNQIKEFFIEKFGTHNRYSYSVDEGDTVEIKEGIYMPEWLPDGYQESTHSETTYFATTIWSGDTDRLILRQKSLSDTGGSFDTEIADCDEILIEEQKYYYVFKNNHHYLIWKNDIYSFTLWCTNIDKDSLLRIATSMKVDKAFPSE